MIASRRGHLVAPRAPRPGFDFLGFNFRTRRVGRHQAGLRTREYKLFVVPSLKAKEKHRQQLRSILRESRTANVAVMIDRLNSSIRGWCHYHRISASSNTFSKMDYDLFQMLWAWAKRRHPKLPRKVLYRKYWDRGGLTKLFHKGEVTLLQHSNIHVVSRYVKVRDAKSPFDGDREYWAGRKRRRASKKNDGTETSPSVRDSPVAMETVDTA